MGFIGFPNNEGGAMLTPGFPETSALVAVLERKSFTKAAEQLGLSPARVSELVRNLEERLGVRLVERTTRSVAATPAGDRLLGRLGPLLDEYQAAFDSLNDFRSKPAGTLRLTVPPPAADFVLAPVLARFISQYPEINLDVSIDRTFLDIVEARFDAGIRPGESIARDMIAVRVSDEMPFVAAASPAYLDQHGTPKTPQELTKHACIRFRLPGGAVPWRFGKKGRMLEVRVDGPLTANEPGIGITAATGGAGLIQLPIPYLAPEIAAGRLVTVLTDWVQPRIDSFFLYYSGRRQMRPPLKALVDFLRDAYRRGPAGEKAGQSERRSSTPSSS
jgi:DNA-binding transcriptional LysR family regulator